MEIPVPRSAENLIDLLTRCLRIVPAGKRIQLFPPAQLFLQQFVLVDVRHLSHDMGDKPVHTCDTGGVNAVPAVFPALNHIGL